MVINNHLTLKTAIGTTRPIPPNRRSCRWCGVAHCPMCSGCKNGASIVTTRLFPSFRKLYFRRNHRGVPIDGASVGLQETGIFYVLKCGRA